MSDIQYYTKQNRFFAGAEAYSGIELIDNMFSPVGFVRV